jgi:hypothetical protein
MGTSASMLRNVRPPANSSSEKRLPDESAAGGPEVRAGVEVHQEVLGVAKKLSNLLLVKR